MVRAFEADKYEFQRFAKKWKRTKFEFMYSIFIYLAGSTH